MCLVVLAFQVSADHPVVLAANRDEFHARPSREAHWWPDAEDILAGRDLQAGGTWLGMHRSGRFATVTNYRDAEAQAEGVQSRGQLVVDFLAGDRAPIDYLHSIDGDAFAGFNLLVGDAESVGYLSNRGGGLQGNQLIWPSAPAQTAHPRRDRAAADQDDLFPIFQQHMDPATLFTGDGIHLSGKGHGAITRVSFPSSLNATDSRQYLTYKT